VYKVDRCRNNVLRKVKLPAIFRRTNVHLDVAGARRRTCPYGNTHVRQCAARDQLVSM
jgi:hypothetical protein